MSIFYAPDLIHSNELSEEESLHCTKVLRKQSGEQIELTDGKGHWATATILLPHAKRTTFTIENCIEQPKQWNGSLHLAIAPTKNMDRLEWFVEKAVEMGIDRISLLRTEHSERKEVKIERIEKIVIAAMKQSKKAYLPILDPVVDYTAFIRQLNADSTVRHFIAYCGSEYEKPLMARSFRPSDNLLILIGPEGDFSPQEVALAIQQGIHPISLGESRLRTETAGLFACSTFHIVNHVHTI